MTKGCKLGIVALIGVLAGGHLHADVKGREIDYVAGDTTMKGYVAWDDAVTGLRPGVLVVHEWWGHNEYARRRARDLAALGYTALAVDMFGEGRVADHPKDAGRFAGELREKIDVAEARFLAALAALRAEPTVDATRVAAIGYCFGGGVVLHAARTGVDLRGVVSFHGSLAPIRRAEAGAVKAAILVCHGAADGFIPPAHIEDFHVEMKEAGADMTFIAYPGAKHSFTNPEADAFAQRFEMDVAYDAGADARSWADMQAFLTRVLQAEPAASPPR